MDFIQYSAFLLVSFALALIPAGLLTYWLYKEYTKYPESIKGEQKKKTAIEKAKEEGRAVTAYLVKSTSQDNEPPYISYCKYEFTYNGKKYHSRTEYMPGKQRELPPQSMEMYFRKSPKHAYTYRYFGHMETETKYIFLISWCIIAIVICIFLISKGS